MIRNLFILIGFIASGSLMAAEVVSSKQVEPSYYNFKHAPPNQVSQILVSNKFAKIDKDKNGFLEIKEIEEEIYNYIMLVAKTEQEIDPKLRQLKMPPQEYTKKMIKDILIFDHDGDGKISINEFQKWHQLSAMK